MSAKRKSDTVKNTAGAGNFDIEPLGMDIERVAEDLNRHFSLTLGATM